VGLFCFVSFAYGFVVGIRGDIPQLYPARRAKPLQKAVIIYDSIKKLRIFATIVWFARKQKFMKADGGRAEGVRFDHIRASAQIFFMDPLNHFRFRQKQKLDCTFEVFAFPIAKTFAAIIGLGQTKPLQSGPHRAVEDDDASAQKRSQGMG